MTVLVGTMQLPVPQDADRVRDYLNGTIADGGLWTGLTRASDHDHTGGLNGKPISVASIPDGSITTGKLDPSVLLPYALVDGSKPFTGQVALNGNGIVRDTLYFGAKPAGAADVTVARTGAGALQLGGTRANYEARATGSTSGARFSQVVAGGGLFLSSNAAFDGTNWNRDDIANPARMAQMTTGTTVFGVYHAAAGANPLTWKNPLVVSDTGRLTLTPDANVPALVASAVAAGSYSSVSISGPAGTGCTKTVNFQTALGNRWTIGADDAAEGGGNAGTNLNINRFSDAGAYINTCLAISRATGTLSLFPTAGQSGLQVNGGGNSITGATSTQELLRFRCVDDASLSTITVGAVTSTVSQWLWNFTKAGTLSLSPIGGAPALSVNAPSSANQIQAYFNSGAGMWLDADAGNFSRIRTNAYLMIDPLGNNFLPERDAAINLGTVGNRWAQVAAVSGTIVTSHVSMKHGFAPLDPSACVEAVLGTDWLSFEYNSPAPPESIPVPEDETPGQTEARKANDARNLEMYQKDLEATAPGRKQRGYVLGSEEYHTADLFGLSDRMTASPGSDLAVIACALQNALKRIAALEARPN